MRIFIAGGTGLVGTRLVARLLARKDDVVVLTRRPASRISPHLSGLAPGPMPGRALGSRPMILLRGRVR